MCFFDAHQGEAQANAIDGIAADGNLPLGGGFLDGRESVSGRG